MSKLRMEGRPLHPDNCLSNKWFWISTTVLQFLHPRWAAVPFSTSRLHRQSVMHACVTLNASGTWRRNPQNTLKICIKSQYLILFLYLVQEDKDKNKTKQLKKTYCSGLTVLTFWIDFHSNCCDHTNHFRGRDCVLGDHLRVLEVAVLHKENTNHSS